MAVIGTGKSVFSLEALTKVSEEKQKEVLEDGYTENVTIADVPLEKLLVGRIVRLGEAEVKILYVGKEQYKEHGRPYIVSREGRFGRVVKEGRIRVGDSVELL
ncbi:MULTISPECIES: hypothetical protein [Dehalobacter]|jgi:MOSC domain-containing protein YiiM|uniref:hypothetical protein n=1 Tax=Dehalobacter TaxID=56112 RepID=UPI0002DF5B93|nr:MULTISPECIES: hypothetical protein [Dehalobacter]MDJ0306144.1 hypothetical protein [Dehalobacter sp.]